MPRILLLASVLAAAAGIALACSDDPLGPAASDAGSPPATTDAGRERMPVTPLVVGDQWMQALQKGSDTGKQ